MKTKNTKEIKKKTSLELFRQFTRLGTALTGTALIIASLTGCGGATTGTSDEDSENTEATASEAFPSSLAVASPFEVVDTADSNLNVQALTRAAMGTGAMTKYTWASSAISDILSGGTAASCRFDPELYLIQETNAGCFGPTLDYENHPDSTSVTDPGTNGELPSGDLGLWESVDDSTGHACSAAQLNARMDGVTHKSVAALMSFASLICTVNLNGLSMPSNSSLDITVEMNALGVTDTTFAVASIAHSDASGTDEYSYELDFDYAPGGDSHRVVADMTHIPGSAAGIYQGRLSYRVNDDMTGGNCPTADVTYNGSLLYDSASTTDMNLEVRQGQFCAHDSDGMTDGLVDPSKTYDAASNPTGWGNNFSIFTADFDPTVISGNYAYTWQAGPQDSNTRAFNIVTEEDATTGMPAGKAFYGYGDEIDATDGSIGGFICNWTGANASHTLQDYAQYQEMSFDSTTKKFTSVTENMTYAPSNSCEYDGTGTYTYDTDADGIVDSDPADVIANDLLGMTDGDGDGVFDEFATHGFTLPTSPANL